METMIIKHKKDNYKLVPLTKKWTDKNKNIDLYRSKNGKGRFLYYGRINIWNLHNTEDIINRAHQYITHNNYWE